MWHTWQARPSDGRTPALRACTHERHHDFASKTRTSDKQVVGIRYSIFFVISIFPAASSTVHSLMCQWASAASAPVPSLSDCIMLMHHLDGPNSPSTRQSPKMNGRFQTHVTALRNPTVCIFSSKSLWPPTLNILTSLLTKVVSFVPSIQLPLGGHGHVHDFVHPIRGDNSWHWIANRHSKPHPQTLRSESWATENQ
jgi:hypothetical protein